MRKIYRRLSNQLTTLSRRAKQALLGLMDVVALLFASWAAFSLRLGEFFVPNAQQAWLLLAAPALALPVFLKVGLYRSVIRYLGEQALWAVLKGMTMAALLWATLAFMTEQTGIDGVPRSVPVLYGLIGALVVGGSRFLARWFLWLPVRKRFQGGQALIYGAGGAGRQLASSLRAGRDMFPAGFLDDNPALHGTDVDALRVYAPNNLPDLLERFDIRDVIVTLPSASSSRRREVVSWLESFPVRVRILPAVSDIANGRHLVNMVREVDIGDLLGRDPVAADPELLSKCVTGKVVLVTGAGGSIGSELCRQIAALGPRRMVLLEASEYALYQIHKRLTAAFSGDVVPSLGSVEDQPMVVDLIGRQGVQTVYHAAAYKHVPIVEANPLEGVSNNILGTRSVAQAALTTGVETFVLISSDKAVRPTNVMGATKRWAELIVQDCATAAHAAGRAQRFCAVRFGNVLGSSGSVIPLFKEQIAAGGPITVTHPEVTRYFMSIHEAVELVIQAGSMARGGEIFLLDMGEPVRIIDLAANMIRLAGHTVRSDADPDGDIEIQVTGLRPGEKLYEELLITSGNAEGTAHPKIMKASEPGLPADRLGRLCLRLEACLATRDEAALRATLMDVALASDLSELDG